jgi:hypothetical protein
MFNQTESRGNRAILNGLDRGRRIVVAFIRTEHLIFLLFVKNVTDKISRPVRKIFVTGQLCALFALTALFA